MLQTGAIVALAIGFGMIPLVADKFFSQMPKSLSPLLHSGILLCSIVAVAAWFRRRPVRR